MNPKGLPPIAAAILDLTASAESREHLAGDLAEEFHQRRVRSLTRARWWYRRQVLYVVLTWIIRPLTTPRSFFGVPMMRLHTDLVSAWRILRRRPRFALIVVIVLGTSLGTSATVLAIAEAFLWRPLPYPSAERLVTFPRQGPAQVRPPRDQSALRSEGLLAEVADLVVSVDVDGFTIVDGATPTTVLGMWTTTDLFTALDVKPALGRTFTASEVAAASPVALISHALWLERFGGDPSIVGRTLTLRGVERTDVTTPFTVIGVLPPRFWHFDSRITVFAPLKAGTGDVMFFRLKPQLDVEQASARLTAVVTAMNPDVDPAWRVALQTLQDDHVAPIRDLVFAVTLAVAMLLLIACSNVGVLQATRALERDHEMAIRSALGAGRIRVARQLIAENLILALAAFALSLLVARGLLGALLPAVETYVGRLAPGGGPDAMLSARTVGIMALVSVVCTVIFGLAAGLRLRGTPGALRVHGPGTDTPRRARLRHGLAALQVAATLALLVGAMLAMRTAWHLGHVDLGFEPAGVMTGSLVLGPPAFVDDGARRRGAARLLEALTASPEIESAGIITVPAFGIRFPRPIHRDGQSQGDAPTAVLIGVSEGYFEAVRLQPIAGRRLTGAEARGLEPVAVVTASLARTLFPSQDAVGETITTTALRPMQGGVEVGPPVPTTYRIVGVVPDVRRSLRREAVAEVYVPLAQAALRDLTLQVRGRDGVPAGGVASAVARAVSSVSRDLPLNGVEPLDALIARQGVRPRFIAVLLAIFAALAGLGAVVGLYAVSAWVAGLRRREAAIRLALGANRAQVIGALARGAALSVSGGLLIGWWVSLALGRLMAQELSGIQGDDLNTRVIAAAVLGIACALAIYRPARAVTAGSPAAALRE